MRRAYLDWLRGLAVLIMIEGHTLDSWTRTDDRQSAAYHLGVLVAGYGAPIFLFLAGITLLLAAGGRLRRGLTLRQTAGVALRRGGWILALAFLFRLQSVLISGARWQSLLKVDILNVIGLSMLAGALGLAAAGTARRRAALFGAAAVLVAMATPLVRAAALLDPLPDPLEAYFRPRPGLTNFTLFPWSGFFFAGCVVGALLDARRADDEGRLVRWLAAAGVAAAAGGYLASFLPPIYPDTSFWTSSPTFFFLRLGVLLLLVAAAYALSRVWRLEPLQEFGRASLFVYWVHVELVYGVFTAPLHRRLPYAAAVAAMVVFAIAMFGLVRLKHRIGRTQQGRPTESARRASTAPLDRQVPRNT